MRASLAALDALAKWSGEGEGEGEGRWGYLPADRWRVVFAGHSMGGHGAWHIATHFPDRALAVSTAAGWIRKVTIDHVAPTGIPVADAKTIAQVLRIGLRPSHKYSEDRIADAETITGVLWGFEQPLGA
jgi:pimeloyl-ACP methyl ester carboxylesterase